jgi:hypothetical protein
MAVAGWLTERQRWRPLRSKRGWESPPTRFSQSWEPNSSVSVWGLLYAASPCLPSLLTPARLPRGHQAPSPRSSLPGWGGPSSGLEIPGTGVAQRPAVTWRATSPDHLARLPGHVDPFGVNRRHGFGGCRCCCLLWWPWTPSHGNAWPHRVPLDFLARFPDRPCF